MSQNISSKTRCHKKASGIFSVGKLRKFTPEDSLKSKAYFLSFKN
jgi:hypothetical protein